MLSRAIVTALALAVVAVVAWHLAASLDALAADRQFAPNDLRRCGIDREWYRGGYEERCGPW